MLRNLQPIGTDWKNKSDHLKATATAYWNAPEILNIENNLNIELKNPFDESKHDIFSVGLIALYCIDNKRFVNYKDKNEKNILNQCPKTLADYLELLAPDIPEILFNIIQ